VEIAAWRGFRRDKQNRYFRRAEYNVHTASFPRTCTRELTTRSNGLVTVGRCETNTDVSFVFTQEKRTGAGNGVPQ